jgi:SAM-dependent methyltransferase
MLRDLDPPDELLGKWARQAPPGRALDLGAGSGEAALWLTRHGFTVEAIESDASASRALAATLSKSNARAVLADIRRHPLARSAYSLISALAFLHFFHPDELRLLARRLTRALAPGGILLASVFTTDDPSLEARREMAEPEIAPATFDLARRNAVIHYFAPGELARLFPDLETLHSEEARRVSPGGDLHAGASFAARKVRAP